MLALLEANSSVAAELILVSTAASKETSVPVATTSHIMANGQALLVHKAALSTHATQETLSGDAARQIHAQRPHRLYAPRET